MTLRSARCNDKESQSATSSKNSRHVLLKETIIVRSENSLRDTHITWWTNVRIFRLQYVTLCAQQTLNHKGKKRLYHWQINKKMLTQLYFGTFIVAIYGVIQKDGPNRTINGASTHTRQSVAVFQVLCSLYGLTSVGYAQNSLEFVSRSPLIHAKILCCIIAILLSNDAAAWLCARRAL